MQLIISNPKEAVAIIINDFMLLILLMLFMFIIYCNANVTVTFSEPNAAVNPDASSIRPIGV
jgi:hypothetical protein